MHVGGHLLLGSWQFLASPGGKNGIVGALGTAAFLVFAWTSVDRLRGLGLHHARWRSSAARQLAVPGIAGRQERYCRRSWNSGVPRLRVDQRGSPERPWTPSCTLEVICCSAVGSSWHRRAARTVLSALLEQRRSSSSRGPAWIA